MLTETYRPRQWADVIGQDKAIRKLQALMARGFAGRAFWVSGASGTGKTTIARLIAAEVAGDFDTEEMDAGAVTVAGLRDLERFLSFRGMTGAGGKALILNEAHGLRKDVIRALLVMLERIPGHAVIVFTTTNDGQEALFDDYDDAGPLLSRCLPVMLSRQGLAKPFAEYARTIAQREGLDGQPLERYVRLVQDRKNNLRAVLQAIEAGEMIG